MHELGITQEIVALAVENARERKVNRIVVEIGKLSAVLPDAIRFCFPFCCEGTVAEGAALEIIEIPGSARCRQCHAELSLHGPLECCPCGSMALDWLTGHELFVKELELG